MARPEVITIENGVTFFILSNKPDLICQCDSDDYDKFVKNTNCWYIHTSGRKSKKISYIRSSTWKTGKHKHLHREIMEAGEYSVHNEVDHRNRDGLDCRKENLWITDHQGNMLNRGPFSKNLKPFNGVFHRNVSACFVEKRGYFQAYHRGKYIAQTKTKEEMISRIDAYLDGES